MIRKILLAVITATAAAVPAQAEKVGVLTLDSFSFISFQGYEDLAIPAGSTLRFRFGSPDADGTIPVTVQPADVNIPEIPLWSSSGSLRYRLASPASGALVRTGGGWEVRLSATVKATLIREGSAQALTYPMTFTTRTASASDATGQHVATINGQQLGSASRHLQLVGATTNKENAFPEPGRAVTIVLSGSFDELP